MSTLSMPQGVALNNIKDEIGTLPQADRSAVLRELFHHVARDLSLQALRELLRELPRTATGNLNYELRQYIDSRNSTAQQTAAYTVDLNCTIKTFDLVTELLGAPNAISLDDNFKDIRYNNPNIKGLRAIFDQNLDAPKRSEIILVPDPKVRAEDISALGLNYADPTQTLIVCAKLIAKAKVAQIDLSKTSYTDFDIRKTGYESFTDAEWYLLHKLKNGGVDANGVRFLIESGSLKATYNSKKTEDPAKQEECWAVAKEQRNPQ